MIATDCRTPGAVYHISVRETGVTVAVDFPSPVLAGVTEIQAEGIEAELHNAMEMALAPYFVAAMWAQRQRGLFTRTIDES